MDKKDKIDQLLGFGEFSAKKSYYPELQNKIKELDEAKKYVSNIINSMPSIIIGIDGSLHIVHWNRTAEEFTGYPFEKVEGKLLEEIIPEISSSKQAILESLKTRKSLFLSKIRILRDTTHKIVDITVYPLDDFQDGVLRIDDITDKVQLEEMLIQNEKMLSLGRMASGLAHEISNPLGGVMQTAEVLKNRIGAGPDLEANRTAAKKAGVSIPLLREYMSIRQVPRMIDTIISSARRISGIIDGILGYARQAEDIKSRQDINEIIRESIKLSRADFDVAKNYDFKKIHILEKYDEKIQVVQVKKTKIQQVIINLLKNAAQAMHEGRTENPSIFVTTKWNDDGKEVVVSIRDNGPGMDEKIKEKIFEPFYTTKPTGEGTGLGLSISFFIIEEDHGGKMRVESSPGAGTTFFIHLPAGSSGSEKANQNR